MTTTTQHWTRAQTGPDGAQHAWWTVLRSDGAWLWERVIAEALAAVWRGLVDEAIIVTY